MDQWFTSGRSLSSREFSSLSLLQILDALQALNQALSTMERTNTSSELSTSLKATLSWAVISSSGKSGCASIWLPDALLLPDISLADARFHKVSISASGWIGPGHLPSWNLDLHRGGSLK